MGQIFILLPCLQFWQAWNTEVLLESDLGGAAVWPASLGIVPVWCAPIPA